VFSVMWSEHCSYKSSKRWLRRLPTQAPWVIRRPGENAGVVDIGDGAPTHPASARGMLPALSVYLETGGEAGGRVAWWAHIAGFVVGAILVIPFRRRGVPLLERDGIPPLPPRTVINRLRHGSVPVTRRRRGW
jgi:hypothetical protein